MNTLHCVLDTNVLLEVLLRRNEKRFSESFAVLEQVKNGTLTAVVPGIVLAEMQWVLSSFYQLPKQEIVEFLESILHLRGLKITDEYDHALNIRLYSKNTAKYINACIASLNCVQKEEYVVLSYDADFKKLPITSATPGSILAKLKKSS